MLIFFLYRKFSRENFFDSNGLFISTVFSIPVLFNCICLIVSLLLILHFYFVSNLKLYPYLKREMKSIQNVDNN